MWNAMKDFQLALRQLRRSGTFTFAVILTLALGIGLNAAIFTMVDCVLLRPLGYHDADRIYALDTRFAKDNRSIPRVGGGDYVDAAAKVQSIEFAAYYQAYQDNLQVGARTLYTDVGHVSSAFGQAMGVQPLAGRLFLAGSGAGSDAQEALVSSAFARQNYGGAAQAVGQSLRYDGHLRTIVGVLPDGFSFPGATQVWIEAPPTPDVLSRSAYNQQAVVKAKPGVTAAELNAELATLSRQLSAAYPEDRQKALAAVPLQDQLVGSVRPTLRLLMGSVVVVLLIVCANITHLQLVRATRLRREVTIRTALGATRMALARRAGLEVLLLAVSGCVAGVLIAWPALQLLVGLAPKDVPRLTDVHLNLDVVAYSFAVSLVTMAVTALLPLWRSWQVDPAAAMKQDAARGLESRGSGRLRQGLIIAEVALTLTLSVMATLLARQWIAESQVDLGFTPDHLVVLDTHKTRAAATLPASLERDSVAARAALQAAKASDVNSFNAVLAGVRGVQGVTSAAGVSSAPMNGATDVGYAVRGVSEFRSPYTGLASANIVAVTPGYLRTMGIPLLKGREISDADRADSLPVLVISESLARQSFAGQDPIGKQIQCGWDDLDGWMTIVGVVGDVRQDSPAVEASPTFYAPLTQHAHAANDMQLVVRTRTDAAVMSANLERYMQQQFPGVAVQASTMREAVGESERAERFRTLLFASFAGVSILLAMTGMFGVTAYTVAQKRFEFALRFALGAQRPQVLGTVLRNALTVAAIGVAAGVVLTATLLRVLEHVVAKMPGFDAASYAIAAAAVLVIALLATLQPAYRAAVVDPMRVLREE